MTTNPPPRGEAFDSTGTSAADAFDLTKVSSTAGAFANDDGTGRALLHWSWAELALAPNGPTARCRVALRTGTGRVAYRELVVTTDGAVLIAAYLLQIALARIEEGHLDRAGAARSASVVPADPDGLEILVEEVLTFPFDDPAAVRRRLDESNLFCVPAGTELHDMIGQVLHPAALGQLFPSATLRADRELVAVSGLHDWLLLERQLTDGRVEIDVAADGETSTAWAGVPVAPGAALALVATQVALHGVALGMGLAPDDHRAQALRAELTGLRGALAGGLDAGDGFARLVRLLHPGLAASVEDHLPAARLATAAWLALTAWWATRSERGAQWPPHLGRAVAVAGAAPRSRDGEHTWEFGSGHLVVRFDGTLAVGRGGVVHGGLLRHSRMALTASRLEWILWALSGIDETMGDASVCLTEFAARALCEPELPLEPSPEAVVLRLRKLMAGARTNDRRLTRSLRRLLDRRPDR